MALVMITAPYPDLSVTLGGARREIDSICSLPQLPASAVSMEYASSSKPYPDLSPPLTAYSISLTGADQASYIIPGTPPDRTIDECWEGRSWVHLS